MTSVYAVVVWFYSSVWKHFDFGPMTDNEEEVDSCVNNYWKNFAYVTNLELATDDKRLVRDITYYDQHVLHDASKRLIG